ncbi:hypothetical protein [Priestia taiwanensis]|uniref:Uncharacterized protein n=1 Tax=Priestia taiwanensis TaxID=1347902 RepID=A0A917EM81_9BACI|nr:hypothetical protein [Priestia taiwanensis]MBM7361669.1 hypothetical protein [Priestia taiwanensis]GGE56041.1 hypothetical protein GCM10007140_02940 [Priestia taiwanensis]
MLPRKIIAASISGPLFAIILAMIEPYGENAFRSVSNYISAVADATVIYMWYSFPVILVYGVSTSLLSDKIGEVYVRRRKGKEEVISFIMHIIFGLVLFVFSLGASILFFITDRLLKRREKEYGWAISMISLVLPILTFFLAMEIAER